MLKKHVAVEKLFVALLAAALFSSFSSASQTNCVPAPLRARQLNGMKVEDSDGQKAGTVRNLVLDMNTGDLRYVIISDGGILGVRSTLKLAPVQMMSAATAKSHPLAVYDTSTQWSGAPAFKYSSLAAIAESDRANEIARYFRTSAKSAARAKDVSLSKTGRNRPDLHPPLLKFGSDVIGMHVVNPKQEKMGEVVDLLVSFGEPRPAFAIISSGRLFHHDQRYAVPLNTLTFSDNKLTWNADTTALQNAPQFDQVVWQSHGRNISNHLYRYSTPGE